MANMQRHPQQAQENEWTCQGCSVVNNINNAKCEVCGTQRPAHLKPQVEEKKHVSPKHMITNAGKKKGEDDWEVINDWDSEQK